MRDLSCSGIPNDDARSSRAQRQLSDISEERYRASLADHADEVESGDQRRVTPFERQSRMRCCDCGSKTSFGCGSPSPRCPFKSPSTRLQYWQSAVQEEAGRHCLLDGIELFEVRRKSSRLEKSGGERPLSLSNSGIATGQDGYSSDRLWICGTLSSWRDDLPAGLESDQRIGHCLAPVAHFDDWAVMRRGISEV
jgi:hypothetical protein